MTRLFIDTGVPVYAAGQDHPNRGPAEAIMRAAAAGDVELHASVEVLQEFCFHRLRRDDRTRVVEQTRRLAGALIVHAFDRAVADAMLDLVGSTALGGRDAVHAATALVHGFDHIVSPDADFDGLAMLRRIDIPDALTGRSYSQSQAADVAPPDSRA